MLLLMHGWSPAFVWINKQHSRKSHSQQGHEGTYRIHPAATYYVTVLVRKLCMFFEITKALLFKVGRARMIASFGSARVHIYSCSHTGSLSKRWFWKWSEPCILYHLLLA